MMKKSIPLPAIVVWNGWNVPYRYVCETFPVRVEILGAVPERVGFASRVYIHTPVDTHRVPYCNSHHCFLALDFVHVSVDS